jgi:hypothetical protein
LGEKVRERGNIGSEIITFVLDIILSLIRRG